MWASGSTNLDLWIIWYKLKSGEIILTDISVSRIYCKVENDSKFSTQYVDIIDPLYEYFILTTILTTTTHALETS